MGELSFLLLGALRHDTIFVVFRSFGLRAAVKRRLAYARLPADSVPLCPAAIGLFVVSTLRLGEWWAEGLLCGCTRQKTQLPPAAARSEAGRAGQEGCTLQVSSGYI